VSNLINNKKKEESVSYKIKNQERCEELFQSLRKKIWENGFNQSNEPKPITYELIDELEKLRTLHQELEDVHEIICEGYIDALRRTPVDNEKEVA
jgi:hypothetical protein